MCSTFNRAILLLGGNESNTLELFTKVEEMVCSEIGKILIKSGDYGSTAWGFQADHAFYNRIIEVETSFSPPHLLKKTMEIESVLGRKRTSELGYSSRAIDIDILFYNNIILDQPELKIPHSKLHLRRFTLLPLTEKWSSFQHPLFKKNMAQLLDECTDQGAVWQID